MDGERFDEIIRDLGRPGSRRRLLAGLSSATLGLLGVRQVYARSCSNAGTICREHANCCSGLCGAKDRTGRRSCGCNSPADCPTPRGQCQAATCVAGTCGTTVAVGRSCDDGSVCTSDTTCQVDGSCGGGVAIYCDDGNVCTTDSCDPTLGCIYAPITCDDGNLCTANSCDPHVGCVYTEVDCNDNNLCTTDSCDPQTGCVHSPVNCDDGDPCTVDTCDPQTGGCVHTPVSCGENQTCTAGSCACNSGFATCTYAGGAIACFADTCCRDRRGDCCPNGFINQRGGCCTAGVATNGNCLCASGIFSDDGCCCPGSTPGQETCSTGEQGDSCPD